MRQRALVAAHRGERVIDVCHAEDAGGERDRLASESVRVSTAVPPFVVRLEDGAYVPGELDVGQHAHALGRVAPHEGELLVRQLPGLVQHLARDHDLPDIVQEGANAEPEQRLRIESTHFGDEAGEIRDALTMALRVPVDRFDRLAPAPGDAHEVPFQA